MIRTTKVSLFCLFLSKDFPSTTKLKIFEASYTKEEFLFN